MFKEYARWQKNAVMHALKVRRVVIVSGPRQSGKTTLVGQLEIPDDHVRTLDQASMLRVALEDPHGFVKHAGGTLAIDEIQKAPGLLPAIKMVVDGSKAPGQFLLTGSANLYHLPEVTESLAGRVANIRLRPLAVGEILERKPSFLEAAFAKEWPAKIKYYDKEAVIGIAFRGGYPEALRLPATERKAWHKDYVHTLLERDLKDIANIRRRADMQNLLEILAAWSGKFMDIAGICGKISIAKTTLETYINLLEALYLFERVPPWVRTDYDRVGRHSKIYATDTGLMSSVLNWRLNDVLFDSDRAGKIVETLVFNELSAQIGSRYEYSLSQYRDYKGREIDFLIESDKGELLGVEVKAGSMVSKEDCRHMGWFRDNLAKDKPFTGVVLYTGDTVLPLGKDMYAVPIGALWNCP
jgi:predicted AAA+ superfamily ATPase